MARPPKPESERLAENVMVRMTSAQARFVEEAAAREGSKPSPFMREASLRAASEILGRPIPGESPAAGE